MLVLGRKENQSIVIGENIRVTIVGRSGSSIRIGVQAPSDVRIVREELTDRQPRVTTSATGVGDNVTEPTRRPTRSTTSDPEPDEAHPLSCRDAIITSGEAVAMPPQAAS